MYYDQKESGKRIANLRKKEAILLFGLSLWGTAIPKLKDFLESAREEEALCYCEC